MKLRKQRVGTGRSAARWLSGILLCALLLPAAWSQADSVTRIRFVSSQKSGPYMEFIEQLVRDLGTGNGLRVSAEVLTPDDLEDRPGDAQGVGLVVAVGTRAALALGRHPPRVPVLHALIPAPTFERLLREERLACAPRRCGAVYVNQPLERMIRVARAAFPDMRRLGVVLGPTSRGQLRALVRVAGRHGFVIETAQVEAPGDLQAALDGVLAKSEALFALPDPLVYNSRTAKSILLTTYRHKVPMIAYSKSYLKAGATLAVYSTPAQLARQAAAMIRRYLRSRPRRLTERAWPLYYSIRINQYVARSLGLDIVYTPQLVELMKEGGDE